MNRFRKLLGWFLELLASSVLTFTGATIVESALGEAWPIWAKIVGVAVVAFGYVAGSRWIRLTDESTRSFRYLSKRFSKFYQRWYKRDGKLFIFCDEVDWLEPDIMKDVVEVLAEKSGRAHLFVRDTNSRIISELQAAGVHVHQVPESVRFQARMSLRTDNDEHELIVRQPAPRRNRNVVRETTDPYFIGIAQDFFRSIDSSVI